MIRRLLSLLVLCALLIPGIALLPSAHATDLTQIGTRAFDDLTRCINTQGTLNIYYLVDESNSLPNTDPERSRAEILATSLVALGSFGEDIKVNYGIGFFGSEFRPWRAWRTVNPESIEREADEFAAEVRLRDKSNETNWLRGVEGAAGEIINQQEKEPGCGALIWLTDGGLWIQGASSTQIDQRSVDEARETLCRITFPELRERNISVFGVLLKNDEALDDLKRRNPTYYAENLQGMQAIRALVEGTGDLEGNPTSERCGKELEDSDSAGALLIATDPVTLALQFLILDATTQGGKQSDLPSGNPTSFEVESGVRKVQLITTSKKWRLTDPDGSTYEDGNVDLEVTRDNGVQSIIIEGENLVEGRWSFGFDRQGTVTNRLLLYSGLTIELDPQQLMAGYKGVISGRLIVESGRGRVDMRDYRQTEPEALQIQPGGRTIELEGGEVDRDGNFKIEITPSASTSEIELRITFRLFTLGGTELAPVSISRFLDIYIPSNYPTFEPSIRLSDLVGTQGSATGQLLVQGPMTGNGSICFESVPGYRIVINKDKEDVDRSSKFVWNITGLDSNNCLTLREQEERSLEISVSNPIAADAEVLASLPVRSISDSQPDQPLDYTTSINFDSSKKRVGDNFFKILFFVLGILIPFLLLYMLNKRTHRLIFGSGIQRAEFQVLVDSRQGILGRDGKALDPKPDDFRFIPSQDDAVEYKAEFGTAKALVSIIPLSEPWAEITAPAETRLLTMVSGPVRLRDRFKSGQIAAIRQDMGKFWVLLLSEKDLLSASNESSVPGRLIVFKRNRPRSPEQYLERVAEVVKTPGVWNRLVEMRKAPRIDVSPRESNKVSEPPSKPQVVAPPPPPSPPGTSFPPPPIAP